MPKNIIYIAIAALFLGILPLPYGYYTSLRIIACGVFAWAAVTSYNSNDQLLPWVFSVAAVLFNPIIPVYLTREIWAGIDVAAGVLLILTRHRIQVPENGSHITRASSGRR